MTASIDRVVTRDLAALADEAKRDLPVFDAAKGIYRDERHGAEARRNTLVEQRRVQLALMPLSLSRVYAHRIGRIAAGSMGVFCAGVLGVLIADPFMLRMLAWFVPGVALNIGMCATAVACAMLLTYVIGTWIAEAWFIRKMRASIETHDDVYSDLDNLARGPIEVAHGMVRRIDGWAVGMTIAGVASLVSVFSYLLVVAGSLRPLSYVLSSTMVFAEPAANNNLRIVLFAVVIGLGIALWIGMACDREHRAVEEPRGVKWFSHWFVLPAALVIGFVTLYSTFRMISTIEMQGLLPASGLRMNLAVGGEVTIVALTAWATLWWRRRERNTIGQ